MKKTSADGRDAYAIKIKILVGGHWPFPSFTSNIRTQYYKTYNLDNRINDKPLTMIDGKYE